MGRSNANPMYSIKGIADVKEQLWDASISANTAAVYKTGFECFCQYVTLSGFHNQPLDLSNLDEELLINFVTYCYQALDLKLATIKIYLSGVRHFYLRKGRQDPLKSNDRLQCILRGIKRLQGTDLSFKNRLPVTLPILKDICNLFSKGFLSPFLDSMMLALCQLAFFGFLRCGEFTVNSGFDHDNCILLKDINFDPNLSYYILNLKRSKTDPFRTGVNIHIFESTELQPVHCMSQYVELRVKQGALSSSPLFIDSNGAPLNRNKFIEFFRHALASLGIDDFKYSGHSFRIGAATSAAAAGVEDHLIQTLGRWSSNCYTRYIRTSLDIIKHAQQQIHLST